MARFIEELKRTHSCGQLRKEHDGQSVVLFGWVQSRRDHGGCIFIDLRDRDGLTQIVFDPQNASDAFAIGDSARGEWVLAIQGLVRSRGQMANPRLATGDIEVVVSQAEVLARSETPTFPIEDQIDTNEDKRLEYRFLDLRRPALQRNLMQRSHLCHEVRQHFIADDFVEVETPFMVKYTPGGARNFLIPSRYHAGSFYALAESPQLFKQLLMASGFDRYFQIVRCFRDEDLRGDRQPEFTQIDLEMSFVSQDDVFDVVERLIVRIWKSLLGIDLKERYPGGVFPRMTYAESMQRFGNDKPDMRFGLEHTDLTQLVVEHKGGGIPMLRSIADKFISGQYRSDLPEEIVKACVVPSEHAMSRSDLDKLEGLARQMGSKGLARAKLGPGGGWTQSPLAKHADESFVRAVNGACNAQEGDLVLFQFGPTQQVHTVLANLRLHLGKKFGLIPEVGAGHDWNLLWVVDPPLFERDEDGGRWVAAHHPFTRPHDSDIPKLNSDPGAVLCHRYDLVLNGVELGGGSIRLHDPNVQAKVFHTLDIPDEEAEQKFGFLLRALRLGAPPHGGIALGLDRLAMLVSQSESLREVIAFPKTQRGNDLMTGAPGPVSAEQLAELKIATLG